MTACTIDTPRLRLVSMTPESLKADMHSRAQLSEVTGLNVPESWPPEVWDASALAWLLSMMEAGPDYPGWSRYITLPGSARPELIGNVGTYGPVLPETTTMEVGYSLVPEHYGHGYATEALAAFLEWLWQHPALDEVRAHTFPALTASIRVLEKTGFILRGPGAEEGTVLYTLGRSE